MQLQLVAVCVLLAVIGGDARNVPTQKLFRHDKKMHASDSSYLPCKRAVTVMYDFSTDISPELYNATKNVIKTQLFQNFNHFERLVVGVYSDYIERSGIDFFQNINDVASFVDEIPQENGTVTADFEFLFEIIADDMEPTNLQNSVIIFTGKFDSGDADDASSWAERAKRSGTHISMIGIQKSVNINILDKVADFAYVFDVTQEQLDQNLAESLFGCYV